MVPRSRFYPHLRTLQLSLGAGALLWVLWGQRANADRDEDQDDDAPFLAHWSSSASLSPAQELKELGRRGDPAALRRLIELKDGGIDDTPEAGLQLVLSLCQFLLGPSKELAEQELVQIAQDNLPVAGLDLRVDTAPQLGQPPALSQRIRATAMHALCKYGTTRGRLAVASSALLTKSRPLNWSLDPLDTTWCNLGTENLAQLLGPQAENTLQRKTSDFPATPLSVAQVPLEPARFEFSFSDVAYHWGLLLRSKCKSKGGCPKGWIDDEQVDAAVEAAPVAALRLFGLVKQYLPPHAVRKIEDTGQQLLASEDQQVVQAARFALDPAQRKAVGTANKPTASETPGAENTWQKWTQSTLEAGFDSQAPWEWIAPLAAQLSMDPQKGGHRLRKWLSDPDPRVRAATVWGLGYNEDKAVSKLLLDTYEREAESSVRRALASALVRQEQKLAESRGTNDARDYLRARLLQMATWDPDVQVRDIALGAPLAHATGFYVGTSTEPTFVIDRRGRTQRLTPAADGFVGLVSPDL